jgi:two-component system, NarL family, nitrate/nitrite response regulator NarL
VAARRLLESEGMVVLATAATGADALALVRELNPDLVLLDIDLGSESGFDVAGQLAAQRSQAGAAGRPDIILMSAHDGDDWLELIAESPAAGFLPKSALSSQAITRLLG